MNIAKLNIILTIFKNLLNEIKNSKLIKIRKNEIKFLI